MTNPDIDPDDLDDLAARFEDIPLKALLAQQNAYLFAILQRMDANEKPDTDQSEDDESGPWYECKECGNQFLERDLKRHGKECFGWNTALGEEALRSRYERVKHE